MKIPNIKYVDKKYFAIALILIISLVLILTIAAPLFKEKSVKAYVFNAELSPGSETELIVTVSNLKSYPLANVAVTASTIDQNIHISDSYPSAAVIGVGEYRVFRFTVIALSSATEGSYNIKVEVPKVSEEIKVKFEVKN